MIKTVEMDYSLCKLENITLMFLKLFFLFLENFEKSWGAFKFLYIATDGEMSIFSTSAFVSTFSIMLVTFWLLLQFWCFTTVP